MNLSNHLMIIGCFLPICTFTISLYSFFFCSKQATCSLNCFIESYWEKNSIHVSVLSKKEKFLQMCYNEYVRCLLAYPINLPTFSPQLFVRSCIIIYTCSKHIFSLLTFIFTKQPI